MFTGKICCESNSCAEKQQEGTMKAGQKKRVNICGGIVDLISVSSWKGQKVD